MKEISKGMNFSQALSMAKDGRIINRTGWNGKNLTVQVQPQLDPYCRPYLFIVDSEGMTVPWVPSQGDLFAEDWVAHWEDSIVKEN